MVTFDASQPTLSVVETTRRHKVCPVLQIILADDNPRVRAAVQLLFEQTGLARIVAEAETFDELQALFADAELTFDAILLDWELPGMIQYNGTVSDAFLKFLKERYDAYIIVWSSHPGAAQAALQTGADAFVSKGEPVDSLEHILRMLANDTNAHEESA